jgi:hypothetical protein
VRLGMLCEETAAAYPAAAFALANFKLRRRLWL